MTVGNISPKAAMEASPIFTKLPKWKATHAWNAMSIFALNVHSTVPMSIKCLSPNNQIGQAITSATEIRHKWISVILSLRTG